MIIVNATLKAKDKKQEEIKKEAKSLIEASKTHEGNISYNLYSDTQSDILMFVEKWQTKEALQKHMQSNEFIEFGKNSKELIEEDLNVEIYFAELLSNTDNIKD